MTTSWMCRTASLLVLTLIGAIAPVSPASASTLVTYYDKMRNFDNDSAPVSADPSFAGTTIALNYGPISTGVLSDLTYSPIDGRYRGTDQGTFTVFTYFNRPISGRRDSFDPDPSDPFPPYVAISGTYIGQIVGGGVEDRAGGSYTVQVNHLYLSGMTADGDHLSIDTSDPSKPIDYNAVSRLLEGRDIPLALVDGYLHLDRYSGTGSITDGHRSTKLLTLTIAGGPAPEPVPEPATVLTFVALIGGLAYRRFNSPASPAPDC
ncbi:PEP-CTERM sorting domain-containing protein [Isosphaeraceae bacterium EP7]